MINFVESSCISSASKATIYCHSLYNKLLAQIKNVGYVPVGLGSENFSNEWLRDNTKINISHKNKYYAEYTFYYWFWKNVLPKMKDGQWVGFCSYREYWGHKDSIKSERLEDLVLQKVDCEWKDYDTIIGEPISVSGGKLIKALKYGKLALLRNPKAIFSKKGRTIRWQFDMFHGAGNLDKAIELLPDKDRDDFRHFTRTETSFARGNMFICKSSKIIDKYYSSFIYKIKIRAEKLYKDVYKD